MAVAASARGSEVRSLAGSVVLAVALLTTVVLFPAGPAPAAEASAARLKSVSYRGYTFKVPAGWPVINLATDPGTCVRFDLHAVYLGTPGANETCPSWLVGSTEALVIQPAAGHLQRTSTENSVSHLITVRTPRISVIGTFDANPTVIYRVLASAGLPAPAIEVPSPGRLAASVIGGGSAAQVLTIAGGLRAASARLVFGVAKPALPALVANYNGLGFDSCATPSERLMRAWRRYSPYRAVGMYIGGSNRACDQANLTPSWVRREAAAGWRFIPLYAGPQARFGQLDSRPGQGTAVARDAALQAERLGFGPRTPIYYDMESYPAADTLLVVRFLSAWTKELHRLGYSSGVYSSSDTGIADLAQRYALRDFAPPDVIFDARWNGLPRISDSVYAHSYWARGRRLHQFSGNVIQTFGGDSMSIDEDYLDVSLAMPGGTSLAEPGADWAHGRVAVFYRGVDHRLWEESNTGKHGGWRRTDLGGYLTSDPTVVRVNAAGIDVFYRGSHGYLWQRSRTAGGWQRARRLMLMGPLGGGPSAVAQPNGVIDVFWKGSSDDHLWHGQYSPGEGWTGPQNLQGSLASGPYPAETRSGQVQVFWKGTDGNLWHVVRGLGTSFTRPVDLGMGPLGGAPHPIVLASGEIEVFWRGRTKPSAIWAAPLRGRRVRGRRVRGPMRQGSLISGEPWPVVAAGTDWILYRGSDGRLGDMVRTSSGRWARSYAAGPAISPRSQPFAEASAPGAPLEVFWTGANGHLMTAALTKSGHWQRPVDLGGKVAPSALR